jgi:hypothetical protein
LAVPQEDSEPQNRTGFHGPDPFKSSCMCIIQSVVVDRCCLIEAVAHGMSANISAQSEIFEYVILRLLQCHSCLDLFCFFQPLFVYFADLIPASIWRENLKFLSCCQRSLTQESVTQPQGEDSAPTPTHTHADTDTHTATHPPCVALSPTRTTPRRGLSPCARYRRHVEEFG